MTAACRLAFVAGLILAMGVLGAYGGSLTQAPADGFLKIPVAGSGRKPPVKFSHRVHEARRVACAQCHHDYQGRRNVWRQGQPVAKCQTCHALKPEARRLDVKNAFHRQCKGCHLRLRQQGQPAGPIQCQACHRPV